MSIGHLKEGKAKDLPSVIERSMTALNFLRMNWILRFISSLTAEAFLCKHEVESRDLLLPNILSTY